MMQKNNRKNQLGQTIIEVIVATGVVVLVLVSIVSMSVLVFRNRRFSTRQTLATQYVSQMLSWIRTRRDVAGWQTFSDIITQDGSAYYYCLSTSPLPSTTAAFQALSPSGSCTATIPVENQQYVRALYVERLGVDEIRFTATMSWDDGGKSHQAKEVLVLRRWL